MDTVNMITQIISTTGFPIACCIALFYYMTKQTEQHKQEMDKLNESINNNTIALNKLAERMKEDV